MKENDVPIGEKPDMNYVTAIITQFTQKNAKEVNIIARGKFIGKAVEVSQTAVKVFLKDYEAFPPVIDSEFKGQSLLCSIEIKINKKIKIKS